MNNFCNLIDIAWIIITVSIIDIHMCICVNYVYINGFICVCVCVCVCNECIYILISKDKHVNSILDCFRFELIYLIIRIIIK